MVVEEFVYLGSLFHSTTGSTCDISGRSAITRATMHSLENQVWSHVYLNELNLYNTCILPMFLYASDCCAISKMDTRRISDVCVCCLGSYGTSLFGTMMYRG